LLGKVSRRLSDNISAADVGKTFGTPDSEVPYPDTYWPMTENGIDANWNNEGSPLEKFVKLTSPQDLEAAKAWNKANTGTDVPGVASWFGICHGWSGAAVAEKPVVRGVNVKYTDGKISECAADETGCTTFQIGDINGLLATIYTDADSKFIGGRCDTKPSDIKKDQDGRIDRNRPNGRGCKGLNPGALLITMGHRMKRDQKPFVINAQGEDNTDQIWNQPAYRYTVNRYETLTTAQAANLVASGKRTGNLTSYKWNPKAKGFVFVDVTLNWVTENGPNTEYVSGLVSTRKTRMVAVVELDKDASDRRANIIGGEYLEDKSVRATRLTVPPFVWITTKPGPETSSADNAHNPYVKTSVVRAIAALGQQPKP
jgi:hypothetical protein